MSFTNASMRQPVKGKPHIVLINGWWRVSQQPRGGVLIRQLWQQAHLYTSCRNRDRRATDRMVDEF